MSKSENEVAWAARQAAAEAEAFYQEASEAHSFTLNELKEAEVRVLELRSLEACLADLVASRKAAFRGAEETVQSFERKASAA